MLKYSLLNLASMRMVPAPFAFLFPLVLSACANLSGKHESPTLAVSTASTAVIGTPLDSVSESAADCAQYLSTQQIANEFSDYSALPTQIDVLVWNTQKSYRGNWQSELQSLALGAELALLQEAMFTTMDSAMVMPAMVASPGYESAKGTSGVLTGSHVSPLASCSFRDREPLLRTVKASSIVQYALPNQEQTLLVANVHAINFSLGLGAFRQQLTRIFAVLEDHNGPILVVGDFNTWRGARVRVLEGLTQRLGLEPATFVEDHRSRVFGQALDHVFSRGLELVDAKIARVESSDHNALLTSFHLL